MTDDLALTADAGEVFAKLCIERGIAADDLVNRALAARAADALTNANVPPATLNALLTILPPVVTAKPEASDYNLARLSHHQLRMLDWLCRKASGVIEERPPRNLRKYRALELAGLADRLEYFVQRPPNDDDSLDVWNALTGIFSLGAPTPEQVLSPMLTKMGWATPDTAEGLRERIRTLEDAALKVPAAMPAEVPASMPANVLPMRPRSIHDMPGALTKPGAPGSWLP